MKRLGGICAVILFITAGAAFAGDVNDPVIKAREARQQDRIAQGIKSGELTPKEAANLERREGRIKSQEEEMKEKGNLTGKERTRLNRELDRTSKDIYKKKHNNRKVHD